MSFQDAGNTAEGVTPLAEPEISLDIDALQEFERQHPILCHAAQHWLSRYYALAAAVGFIPADQVMTNVNREALLLNAQLAAKP